MTSAHLDRIKDVLATKNRELTKQMFREIAGAEPDNKWATKDIAKRVRDIAAAQVDPIDPMKVKVTFQGKPVTGFHSAEPISIADHDLPFEAPPAPWIEPGKEWLEPFAKELEATPPPPAPTVPASCRCHPGTLGPCPARASLGKFKAGRATEPSFTVQVSREATAEQKAQRIIPGGVRVTLNSDQKLGSKYFSPELIEEIRQRTREDIPKVQADENADLGPVRPLVSPILPPLVTEQSRRIATVTRRTAKTLNPKTEDFPGAKAILAALKPGQILTHHYRDPATTACRVEVITPPGLDGKGGVYSYKHAQYKSLRKIAKLDSGQDFNILYFFGLAAWPKHKKKLPAEAV